MSRMWNKVFGIGLPKTGTTSLTRALEMLGYSTVHWPDTWRQQILWSCDWSIPPMLETFEAFSNFGEWWFDKLDQMFPDSAFILTLRPIDQWLSSCHRWWADSAQSLATDAAIFHVATYDPVIFRSCYEIHRDAVCRYFRERDNLLVFEAPFDWEPLCRFLGRPVPETPYPRANTYHPRRNIDRGRTYALRSDVMLDRIPHDRSVVGAEIGVLDGRNAARLLEARPLLHLYLVDLWREYPAASRYRQTGDGNAAWPQSKWDEFYSRVQHLAERHPGRVWIIRNDSIAAAGKVADGSLDFAFIDADHSYEGCLTDIRAWASKVKLGGWIGGHDYNPHWGVPRAVDQWARETGCPINLDADSTWFCWRLDSLQAQRSHID